MYKMPVLSYNLGDLEPFISAKTMTIHYEVLLKRYLDNLNALLIKNNFDFKIPIYDIPQNIDMFPMTDRGKILFNLGGYLNHVLYFNNISPFKNNYPVDEIRMAIERKYESYDNFKKEFADTASLLVGSGYTFLVLNRKKELMIINTSNQETPYTFGFIPIMTMDLWEHAYYLDYYANKNSYINNFFNVVDFNVINDNYIKALKN